MPILLDRLCSRLVIEIPDRSAAQNDPEDGHRSDPDIEETRGEIISGRAQWTPTFWITACWLEEVCAGRQVVRIDKGVEVLG